MIEKNAQILVVGAGGLGCEILKNLALSGIKNIFVIDLDTIELSNLNRQFLFRQKDIGKNKAEVASEYIKNKYSDITIKWSNKKVQELADDFFRQFHVIIGGLDNLEARRWLNSKVHDLVEFDENGNVDQSTIIPYVDGGTEGFRGQCRVVIPYTTSCLECTQSLNSNRNVFALCTIAETPRLPEHCIEYIYLVKWKEAFDRPIDKDCYDDVNWVCQEAVKRAEAFGIEGVNYSLTLGVLKNVIPAIASTNAIIAAATCLEALKILTACSKILDNNFMYMGHEGVYADTNKLEKLEDCIVCSVKKKNLLCESVNITLSHIIDNIKNNFNLEAPSVFSGGNIVYLPPNTNGNSGIDLNYSSRLTKTYR